MNYSLSTSIRVLVQWFSILSIRQYKTLPPINSPVLLSLFHFSISEISSSFEHSSYAFNIYTQALNHKLLLFLSSYGQILQLILCLANNTSSDTFKILCVCACVCARKRVHALMHLCVCRICMGKETERQKGNTKGDTMLWTMKKI